MQPVSTQEIASPFTPSTFIILPHSPDASLRPAALAMAQQDVGMILFIQIDFQENQPAAYEITDPRLDDSPISQKPACCFYGFSHSFYHLASNLSEKQEASTSAYCPFQPHISIYFFQHYFL